MKEVKQKSR